MLTSILFIAGLTMATPPEKIDTTVSKHIELDEVTITEFKQNKHNLTPSSISVANATLIGNQGLNSLKELTAVMPNFFMPDYGSKQNTPVYIRGVGAKTKGPAVGFYVDGIPHFENSAFDIDLSDVADVEVFRGPQGTLYGRNAIGGIINVHTISPFAYQGSHLKIGYGSQNDITVQAANYTKLSSQFGFSIAGGYHHNQGFFTNEATGKKADGIDEGFGRINLLWRPADNWFFRLNSMLNYSDQGGYPYGTYNKETNKVANVNYNRCSSYHRLISTSGLNARYDGEHFSFNSQTSYQFIKDSQGIDQDFMPQDFFFVRNKIKQNMASQEFTLKSNDNSRYQWIVGAFGMIQNIDNNVETQYIKKNQGQPATSKIPVYAFALYHQSSYNIWKGLSATLGLRFDYEYAKQDYHKDAYQLTTNNGRKVLKDFHSSLHFSQITPKFALQYLTNQQNLFYASVTRGYKAGGFNQSFRTDDERTYTPEFNWNYEVGAKIKLLNQKLMAEVALFYIDWRNQQVNLTVPGVGNILHNAGHSDSKGVEVSLSAQPIQGLNLQMSYGYTYARFIDYQKNEKVNYAHNLLPMVPRNTLGVNASYTLVPRNNKIVDEVVFSCGMTGVGKIYWTEDNAVSQDFYALLNAKISATRGIFSWELWSKNLTDTTYSTYCFKSSAYYAQLGKPMSFGTSLIVRF